MKISDVTVFPKLFGRQTIQIQVTTTGGEELSLTPLGKTNAAMVLDDFSSLEIRGKDRTLFEVLANQPIDPLLN